MKNTPPDLRLVPPRSPRDTLAGYVIAARAVDICRAHLAGQSGAYLWPNMIVQMWLDFTGISVASLEAFVATGASDADIEGWIKKSSKVTKREDIVVWNNSLRYLRISERPVESQMFFEDYIPQCVPKELHSRIVYYFDVYDAEEGRLK
jgi:Domain of unknown function (DUF5069)